MENQCRSCHHTLTGEYCSNCGQKAYKRIDGKYVLNAVQQTVLQMDKGFFYSLKRIMTNPGKTAKEFIEGNRVKHYKPIPLVFILSAFSTFLSFKVLKLHDLMYNNISSASEKQVLSERVTSLINSNYPLLMLLSLPFFALLSKLLFRKWGHNYYEHIVMNAYILVFYTVLSVLVSYPILYLIHGDVKSAMLFSGLFYLIFPFLLVWFFKNVYTEKPIKTIIWKVLVFLILVFISFIITTIIGLVILYLVNPGGIIPK